MKKLKRILSMLLVVCMIFTSQAFVTFAEGMENTEAIVKETTIEETTVKETTAEETTVGESDLVGASSASAETETELTESEEGSHSSPVQGEKEPEETTEEAKLNEPETEYAEEPEEDEIETEIRMGELSEPEDFVGAKLGELETEVKTESEAETEIEEELFGDPPIYTLSLEPNFPEGFSLPEGRSWYEDKSGPLYSDTDSILIEGWNTRICVDTAGNVCNLTGYNTKADGSGTRFSYQESIFKENLEYFNLPSDSYDLVLYAMWRTSNLYTLHYNQNLPEGYSLAEGSTWGSDATLWDYVDEFVFEIYDYTGMTCEDSDGKTLALIKWNTAADGTGNDYSFGDWFTNESLFTDGELTLYAVWEPVAPAPTAFAYWIVTGDGDNKTIHYYATAGEGRTAIVLDETTGVVYSGLDKESVKYAIIEDRIEVTDAKSFFSGFYYLETITGLSNLDTSKATSFWSMFLDCESLTGTLDVSTFDTSSLIYMHQMFSSCALLTSINFGDNFDTSNVTNMSSLFYACSSLQTITFGDKFKTNKVTEMGQMFSTCNDLQSLDLTGFDTSVVVDMEGMFGGCMALTSLDLTSFDTSSVTNMRDMFASCLKLKKIYVSDGFTVENVEYSDDMFRDNTQLEGGSGTRYSDVSEPYDKTYAHIDGGTTNPGFFSGASTPSSDKNFYVLYYADDANYSTWTLSEKHISASADATAKEAFANDLFNNCIYNLSAAEPRGFYKIHDGSESYDVDNAKSAYDRWSTVSVGLETNQLIAAYDAWVSGGAANDVYYGTLINTYFYLLHYDSDGNPAFIQVKCTDTEDTVNAYLATIKGSAPSGKKFKTWQYWHADWYEEEGYDYSDDGEKEFYKNLVENPSNFETDADVIETFNNWTPEPYENRHYGAIYEDDTPAPTGSSMYWIIEGTGDDKTIYYYSSAGTGRTEVAFDTNGVAYTSLESLERQSVKKAVFVDNISLTDVRSYFTGFSGLESITGLGKLDTTSATSFKSMFDDCSAITTLDVSGLETNNLTDTSNMFDDCRKVTTITFGDNFDTSKVTNMKEMFSCCNKLTTINFGSKFDTSNVTDMTNMFVASAALEELDLTKFDTSNVTNMTGMFAQCQNLKTINVSDKFKVDKVTSSSAMFYDCTNLIGGQGTTYDASHIDKAYAHIDEGISNPGYFTASSSPTPPTPPTPSPTPRPYVPGGGDSSSSSSGSSDPTHGPMGDLTKNPLYADTLNGTNSIPESKMVSNDTLATTLKSYPENVNSPMVNARDDNGNVGYGQWLRVPNTTTWYFLSGSFNQGTGTTNTGFLANGWFNLGWDGQDKWYYFDGAGVMKIGWHQEGNKIYYLQADFSDNWYGKAMTGQQMIGGQIYNFDSNGALIQ